MEDKIKQLQLEMTQENLWECIILLQEELFFTVSGLPFRYTLKKGKNGEYTKELWVDRRKDSKSLAWGSFKRAFNKVCEQQEIKFFERPKALGDIRGVSYIYPIFYRLGIIEVPEKFKEYLKARK